MSKNSPPTPLLPCSSAPLLPRPLQSKIALFLGGCLLFAGQTPLRAETYGTPSLPSFQSSGVYYTQYLVYVKGDSDLLLDQVRQIQPEAQVRQYGGRNVIQVGVFNDEVLADRQRQAVEAQYIDAEIVRLEARGNIPPVSVDDAPPPPPPSLSSSSSPSPDYYLSDPCTLTLRRRNNYFVVVPAAPQQLYDIQQQVIRLGAPTEGICDREKPRGYHVAVGPFQDRNTAERWNRYLLDFGLKNSRVYYGQ